MIVHGHFGPNFCSLRIVSSFNSVNRRVSLSLSLSLSLLNKLHMSRVVRKPKTGCFVYANTKTQISFAVTAKLFSAFVFATRIVQSLYFLNPKFQASSHLLWLYSPLCVGPGRKPRRPVFSQRGLYISGTYINSSHLQCCLGRQLL